MRTQIMLPCLALAACATPAPDREPAYASVRERLTAEPARLFIATQPAAGTLEARRWSQADGWVPGTAPVALQSGELIVHVADSGQLVTQQLGFAVDAIDLPATIAGVPLQLRDIHMKLAAAPPVDIAWATDDEGTAQVPVELSLAWSVAVDGAVTPLGEQRLTAMPMDIAVHGDGEHVEAMLGIHGRGTLWSWAELLELTAVDLAITAATVD